MATKTPPSNSSFDLPQSTAQQNNGSSVRTDAFADATKSSFAPLQVPQISLPKGGGALKSIDEKFEVNAANGTASFSVPLPVSKTRSDFAPALSLSYNSGSGNGSFGLGWQLSTTSIQRKTDKQLPLYEDASDSDIFLITGAEDLVPMLQKDGMGNWEINEFTQPVTGEKVRRYRPRIESAFNRIERITPKDSRTFFWKVTSSNNVVTIYGRSLQARIVDPKNADRVFQWLPEFSFDDKGNCMEYEYVPEDFTNVSNALHEANRLNGNAAISNVYLKRIKYGNTNPYQLNALHAYNPDAPVDPQYVYEIVFDYGDHDQAIPMPAIQQPWPCRHDAFSDYHACFEVRTYRLCQRILFFHYFKELNDGITAAPCLVKSLDIQYRYFNNPAVTVKEKLNAETDFIISVKQVGYKKTGATYSSKSLPPLQFGYQELQWNTTIRDVSDEDAANAPVGLGSNYQWLDLWNEGISGILSEQANGWFYKSNLGDGTFTVAEPVIPKPSLTGLATGVLQLQDLEADGRKFVVSLSGPAKGFFELSDDEEWQPFQSFVQLPNINFNDANTKFLDLNGDGKPDLMVSEENVFTWYEHLGIDGFDAAQKLAKPYDEEKGPALVFADPTQSIFLADMSGDGLTDIVRIRNGEVCYWPNMGYGKFGAKVAMSNAPAFDKTDLFNPAYIHLSDISGTGATDILYLGQNGCRAWLNLSGNAWSETQIIDPFFHTDLPSNISVVDFLGNGTACIVWSSPLPNDAEAPLRYIDLMGGKKPYLLNIYKNNLGKEVVCEYKGSTFFYLQDRKAGTPWITKLPFPVQCLTKIETNDKAAGTFFTASYTYHHGYYDHAEREFRGFGRVEQTDTEDFENFVLSGANNVVEEDLHQPPVKTITWFHTGCFFDGFNVLNQFEKEYFKGVNEFDLPQPVLPEGLTAVEYREALRACKGMVLRQEVYALDKTPLQTIPYSVAIHNCLIKIFQPQKQNPFAVFYTHESEAATFYYERNTADPRIAHKFSLEVDDFGYVLQSAAVVYGRKTADVSLPADVQDVQSRLHVVYSTNDYTNAFDQADAYRLPLSAESRIFELIGVLPSNGISFSVQELLTAFSGAATINFETAANNVTPQKRLVENVQTRYLKNDLVTPLALKQLDTLGLQYQQYRLAFSPSLFSNRYGTKATTTMLTNSKYQQVDGVNWWLPSGTNLYLQGGETIANAQQRFYMPVAAQDAFGNQTILIYDAYHLLLTQTEDAVHNKSVVEAIDYRVPQGIKQKDANNNRSEILLDELNMVIATSLYGDEGDGMHGDQPLSSYVITVPVNLDEVITDPYKFLQKATSFSYYDLDAWISRGQPACFATIQREKHESELGLGEKPKVQFSVGYTSGLGQTLQTKMQAEPGVALQWQGGAVVPVDTTPNLRWIGSGRTILNNKGNPVKQYEPFFSTTYVYETEKALVEIGFSSTLYYDAFSRNIRTEHPNGTFATVEFDAWKQLSFDENDTVIQSTWYSDRGSPNPIAAEPADPETRAAWLAAHHANTPAELHFDAVGRIVYTIDNNGAIGNYATRHVLDVKGNPQAVIDARGNAVMQYDYDISGRKVHQMAMDSGEQWLLPDALDKPVYKWDDGKHRFHTEYDALHRPTKQWLVKDITINLNELLIGLTVYGEGQPNDTVLNLRGKVFQTFDQSGLVQTTEYDFKGNAKSSFKRLASDYKNIVDWNVLNPLSLLEVENFPGSGLFDALSRPTTLQLPDGSKIMPVYNEAGLLDQLNVFIQNQNNTVAFVQNIDYNAKGQREKILYGNNTLTRYTYDETNYRLTRLRTTRNMGADILQDLNYTYDPVGNITQIIDQAQQTIFFNNAAVDPSNKYEYDAVYRLTRAVGREHIGSNAACDQFDADKTTNGLGQRLTLKGDMNAMQNYEQLYDYDAVGNMLHMIHNAGLGIFQNKWTRTFTYNASNNQLATTKVGATTTAYSHDALGNLQNLQNGSFNLTWNYASQLQQINLGGGGIAYYVYDSSGQRVRKVIENGNLVKERIYLGNYEVYRERQNNNLQLERQTVHVMDDKQRIALVETRTQGNDPGLPFLIRYQYSNHLGTACLELDGNAVSPDVISYEEFYPFGNTAYQATRNQTETPKRYRYTGKERDEESGLYYHGARHYAAWLCRWTATDPVGVDDGVNVYAYVSNNPVKLHDPNGTQDEPGNKDKPAPPPPPPSFNYSFPYTYHSWGDQVGKDSGSTLGLVWDVSKDSPPITDFKKRTLDALSSQLTAEFKKDWDDKKTRPGLVLGGLVVVLPTAAVITYLSVANPKLDIPVVGKTPTRTLGIGLGSALLGLALGGLTDDKLKVSADYKEDDKTGKGTYSGEVEVKGDKGGVKLGGSIGDEKSIKGGVTATVAPDVKVSTDVEYKVKDDKKSLTVGVTVPIKIGSVPLIIEGKGFYQPGPFSAPTTSPFSPKFDTDDPSKGGYIFAQPFLGSGGILTVTIPTSLPGQKKEKK
jgi:RHS repeat-associated protein